MKSATFVRTQRLRVNLDKVSLSEVDQMFTKLNGMPLACMKLHRTGKGLSENKGGCWMHGIGRAEVNLCTKGLAFLIPQNPK